MKNIEIILVVIIVIGLALYFFSDRNLTRTRNPGGMCIPSNQNDQCPPHYPQKSCVSVGNKPMVCQCCDVPQ